MDFIIFDEERHEYADAKTDELLPSVTKIVGAVYGTGLEHAPSQFVERAAGKGKFHHTEFDTCIKTGKKGKTPEFNAWYKVFGEFKGESEQVVYAHTPYGSFAGTVDFFSNGFIYDWKTSKTATKSQIKKWQMQLSFYCYALRKMGYTVNEPLKIVHITDKCEVINVDYLGDDFVENTVKMYYEGKKAEDKPETSLQTVDEHTLANFGAVLLQIAELEKSIEPIREKIKKEMEKRGILALDLGAVSVNYVAPYKSKKFDSTRFKAEHADIYEKYVKESTTKSSIRVKLK